MDRRVSGCSPVPLSDWAFIRIFGQGVSPTTFLVDPCTFRDGSLYAADQYCNPSSESGKCSKNRRKFSSVNGVKVSGGMRFLISTISPARTATPPNEESTNFHTQGIDRPRTSSYSYFVV